VRSSPSRSAALAIGDVAQASGLTVEAIRYYERLGLLPNPHRTAGRLRRYDSTVLSRLAFIAQAKDLGLSLAQIRDIISGTSHRVGACKEMYRALSEHIGAVDRKLTTLTALRATLVEYQQACSEALSSAPDPSCPTLALMESQVPAVEAVQSTGTHNRHD
jgi:DNA-binding transcriptional MerR regulator